MSKRTDTVAKWIGVALAVSLGLAILYPLLGVFVTLQWARTHEGDVSSTNLFRSVAFPLTNALGRHSRYGAMGDSEEWHRFEAGREALDWLVHGRGLEKVEKGRVPERFWKAGPASWNPADETGLMFYCCRCPWNYGGDGEHVCLAVNEETGRIYYRRYFHF